MYKKGDNMTTITISSEKPIVVLDESDYRQLLDKLENLEDLLDHYESMKDYHSTGGRSFREHIVETEES